MTVVAGCMYMKTCLNKNTQDGEDALKWTHMAVMQLEHQGTERSSFLHALFDLIVVRYGGVTSIEDISGAIQIVQEVLSTLRTGDALYLEYNILLEYLRHGEHIDGGRAEELQSSILSHSAKARERAGDDVSHDVSRGRRLQSVAFLNLCYYKSTRLTVYLEAAIDLYQYAVRSGGLDQQARGRLLADLSSAYHDRYNGTGAVSDLTSAIRCMDEALSMLPDGSPTRIWSARSLGVLYLTKYTRMLDKTDLEMSLKWHQEVLDCHERDHRASDEKLQSLAHRKVVEYQLTQDTRCLDEALLFMYNALGQIPKHDNGGSILLQLGGLHLARWQRTDDRMDLERSIVQYQRAFDHAPSPSYLRARLAIALGHVYSRRHMETTCHCDIEKAASYLHLALEDPSAPHHLRLQAAWTLMGVYSLDEDWEAAYQVAKAAVSLVSLLTPRLLENAEKQHRLSDDIHNLASAAAGIALMAGKSSYEALHLLELGRGVIIGAMEEMRVDISDLRQQHPELAVSYMRSRDILDDSAVIKEGSIGDDDLLSTEASRADRRYKASQALTSTLQAIRELPGFSQFLLPPTEEETRAAAASAPIIVVNVSRPRCDALIITTDSLVTVRLPALHLSDVVQYQQHLRSPNEISSSMLEWLWDAVAGPVLEHLGIYRAPEGAWPRIRWILTGLLAQFPIHAAGYHDRASASVLDRAISSYGFSLRSLVRDVRNQHSDGAQGQRNLEKIVLVGAGRLPFVPEEMKRLVSVWQNKKISRPEPNCKNVLEQMNDCDVFHFAGHGSTNKADPLKSALVLRNDEHLTLSSIFDMKLLQSHRRPFLAYLSACGTGRMKNDRLMDEGLHLISGFQLAGFQHVIGTLWDVGDRSCVEAATLTHRWLQEQNSLTAGSVSEALHHTIRKLRSDWQSNHSGAARNERKTIGRDDTSQAPSTASSWREERMEWDGLELRVESIGARIWNGYDAKHDKRDAGQRAGRNVVGECEEQLLHWVPFVHFGL